MSRPHEPHPAASITSAAPSLTEDLDHRTRRYLLQMGIRVACFLGAVAVDHWTRWLLLAGAVVLPYIAVVGANPVGVRRAVGPAAADDPAVGAAPRALPPAGGGAGGTAGGKAPGMGAD